MFRKTIVCLAALLISVNSFAGSVDYMSQQSSDFLRMMSKNGSLSGADLVAYNPAGTAQMAQGWHISVNSQSFLKDYKIESKAIGAKTDSTYGADNPTPFIPSAFAVYKKNNWSLFSGFSFPAGGGTLEYKKGLNDMALLETANIQDSLARAGNPAYKYHIAKIKKGNFEGSSLYMGFQLGGAYAFSDELSLSLAGRYIYSPKSYKGSGDFYIINAATSTVVGTRHRELDSERSAHGVGAIIGLNYKFNEQFNLGMKYESMTALQYESETKRNDWSGVSNMKSYNDGEKQDKDLPAMFSIGLNFKPIESLELSGGMNYYFIEMADHGADGLNDSYDNGYELQIGVDYAVLNALNISAGYNYVKVGGNKDTYNDFEYQLDSHFFGGGLKYFITDNFDITLAANKVLYIEGNGFDKVAKTYTAKYNKDITIFSVGLGFSLK